MGMFDYVKCEYPLPIPEMQGRTFQTKSIADWPGMDTYTITTDGRLILHEVRWEPVPEEQRPYYGKPEWKDGSLFKFCGSMKTVPIGDKEIPLHGDVTFYDFRETGDSNSELVDFVARFTNGRVESIRVATDES
jgi:hypothetical protein